MTTPTQQEYADLQRQLAAQASELAAVRQTLALETLENARLSEDVREALAQQLATADILRVIRHSPADAQPVFDAIAERATALCRASMALVTRFDGELVHFAAHHGEAMAGVTELFPLAPSRLWPSTRTILDRRPVVVSDLETDPELGEVVDIIREWGYRGALAVPLLRDGIAIG